LSRPSFDVTGKHYIITGGTQGLGFEIARQLKALGAARLALLSRTRSKGEEAVAELNGGGCTAAFVEADMGSDESLQASAASAIEVLGGRVDGLVNAAGNTERGNLLTTTTELFDRQIAINLRAPFLLTQALAKHWIKEKVRGSVVNISSAEVKAGHVFLMAYCCTKSALDTLTKLNAAELARYGIRVNSVGMGWTWTDNEMAHMDQMFKNVPRDVWLTIADAWNPLKRQLRPQDIACTVCFLLSPASEMMTGARVDHHPHFIDGVLDWSSVEPQPEIPEQFR
jgi:NAD(P)-dependent dehydrogenase (short-subunit alcohol dehydrogenase family)